MVLGTKPTTHLLINHKAISGKLRTSPAVIGYRQNNLRTSWITFAKPQKHFRKPGYSEVSWQVYPIKFRGTCKTITFENQHYFLLTEQHVNLLSIQFREATVVMVESSKPCPSVLCDRLGTRPRTPVFHNLRETSATFGHRHTVFDIFYNFASSKYRPSFLHNTTPLCTSDLAFSQNF